MSIIVLSALTFFSSLCALLYDFCLHFLFLRRHANKETTPYWTPHMRRCSEGQRTRFGMQVGEGQQCIYPRRRHQKIARIEITCRFSWTFGGCRQYESAKAGSLCVSCYAPSLFLSSGLNWVPRTPFFKNSFGNPLPFSQRIPVALHLQGRTGQGLCFSMIGTLQ